MDQTSTTLEQVYTQAVCTLSPVERLQLASRLLNSFVAEQGFFSIQFSGWAVDFFERTAGSINDDTFFRHPQGEFEQRESFHITQKTIVYKKNFSQNSSGDRTSK